MKCKIIEKKGLYTTASDKEGNKIMVLYASMFLGEEIEVEKKDKFYIPRVFNYKDEDILSKYENKEGLIEISKLTEIKGYDKRFYEIEGYWFAIPRHLEEIVEYIYENNLVEGTFIKLEEYRTKSISGAPIINVNYDKMFNKIVSGCKSSTAHYFCEDKKDTYRGAYADFFVKADRIDEDRIQFQLWQLLGKNKEVLYTHFIKNLDADVFEHFDLAYHYINNVCDIEHLFEKKAMEILDKQKWFRNDTNFSEKQIFDITKKFFPMDELVDEFLCKEL